jgi:cell division septum initiation protein DivIVA
MSTEGPGRAAQAPPALAALPRFEEIPHVGEGLDPERVREAFDVFRRHAAQMQAQLRVLQAAGSRAGPAVEPTGHAVRMDALHLIRAASEFADTIERDAQNASAAQLARTEEEVSRRQRELQEREAEIERYRQESERLRADILNAAKNEARELRARSDREATQEVREAEARAARLLEQARHQATELTNATRAEVEQTLEWARAQASAILARAQNGAEQLLAAAGLGKEAIDEVAEAIVRAAGGTPEPPPAAAPVRAAVEPRPAAPEPSAPPPEPPSAAVDEPEPSAGDEPEQSAAEETSSDGPADDDHRDPPAH